MSNVMPDGADDDLQKLIESLTMGEQVCSPRMRG